MVIELVRERVTLRDATHLKAFKKLLIAPSVRPSVRSGRFSHSHRRNVVSNIYTTYSHRDLDHSVFVSLSRELPGFDYVLY